MLSYKQNIILIFLEKDSIFTQSVKTGVIQKLSLKADKLFNFYFLIQIQSGNDNHIRHK